MVPEAPVVFNSLKGLICVYKPAETSVGKLRSTLIRKICNELNNLEVRPPTAYVSIEGNPSKSLTVAVKPNLADHPLVVGARYQQQDVPVSWANYLGYYTSGVLLFGIRSGTRQAKYVREQKPARTYKVKGVLGEMTDNCYKTGKVIEKSTWKHVRRQNVDAFLSGMQASHQRKMFEMCGVDLQSQAAYDLATQGLLRPANSKIPILYGIKCVDFQAPEFTIVSLYQYLIEMFENELLKESNFAEIQCINEYEDYLTHIINEIGLKLHSTAHCTGIQCIRHSRYTLEHALLMKHWTLDNILTNMEQCRSILREINAVQTSAALTR